jgi:hypothetical protein
MDGLLALERDFNVGRGPESGPPDALPQWALQVYLPCTNKAYRCLIHDTHDKEAEP